MTQPKKIRKMVNLGDLKFAPYNPVNRTTVKAIRGLIDSMELIGQLSPIIISPTNQIIDGHRRVSSAKQLGWKEIECIVISGEPTAIYASVNVSSRPMNGNDALCVWLNTPLAAPAKLIPQFNKMEQVLGRPLIQQIANAGFSIRLYKTAQRITNYCEKQDLVVKVVEWLLEFPVAGQVMKAMESGVAPAIIMEAVKKKHAVKLSLTSV